MHSAAIRMIMHLSTAPRFGCSRTLAQRRDPDDHAH
jgi:hypothetical protein